MTTKKYYQAHREQILASRKRYYELNREKQVIYDKNYRETHKEQRVAYKKKWDETHKEHCATYNEKYRKEHPNYYKEWLKTKPSDYELQKSRRQRENNPERVNARQTRYRKKYPFKIKAQWKAFSNIPIVGDCADCGSLENLERHHPDYSEPLEVEILCHKCHVKRKEAKTNPLKKEA